MKRIIFLISMTLFLFACTEEGSLDVTKHCWEFDMKVVVNFAGQTSSGTSTVQKCDLNESQANKYMKELNSTVTTTSSGYTSTTTNTCTNKRKLD